MLKQVEIYTDGSCLGNPGPGGYAAILRYKERELILTKGYRVTTNNRMELMAAIVGIEMIKERCEITVYTDSQYVRNGVMQWLPNWKNNGWRTSTKKPVKNLDLWMRMDKALKKQNVEWIWVRGHSGHPENERCDVIAKEAAMFPTQDDIGFKQLNQEGLV